MERSHYAGDPLLNLGFTPESVRKHFTGLADEMSVLACTSDESLAEAARRVVPKDQALSEAVCQVFELILDEASAVETARRN